MELLTTRRNEHVRHYVDGVRVSRERMERIKRNARALDTFSTTTTRDGLRRQRCYARFA